MDVNITAIETTIQLKYLIVVVQGGQLNMGRPPKKVFYLGKNPNSFFFLKKNFFWDFPNGNVQCVCPCNL